MCVEVYIHVVIIVFVCAHVIFNINFNVKTFWYFMFLTGAEIIVCLYNFIPEDISRAQSKKAH